MIELTVDEVKLIINWVSVLQCEHEVDEEERKLALKLAKFAGEDISGWV